MTGPLALPQLCRPDRDRPDPLAVQVYRDLLAAIRDGHLSPGATLPSSRTAARALELSRGTINTAYDLLRAEGAVEIRRGAAPRVTAAAVPRPDPPDATPLPRPLSARGDAIARNPRATSGALPGGAMVPGQPAETLFPADEWARALRRVARRTHGAAFSYGETHGLADLRRILSDRLAADRGLTADPERIVVTTGTQGSLALAAQILTDPGDIAAIEDPGYLGARIAFQGAGLTLAPLPVDDHGARADAIPDGTRLVYLTPSNHYPLGVRLSHARRGAMLARAAEIGAVILEDDYDSEFLWRGREIAPLAADAPPGGVIHLGSAAKVLMPALRLGWMVVPPDLVDPMRAAQRNLGLMANLHAQAALAEIMRTGRYRAQLRRIARVYEPRGRALADALGAIGGLSVRPPDGGVQIAAIFDDDRSEDTALSALAARGAHPARLSAYALDAPHRGLVIGFADATPDRIARLAAILAQT